MIDFLRAVGEALYGPRWQAGLARDLGVNERTVRRWVAGASPMPAGLAACLGRLCLARIDTLRALAERIEVLDAGNKTS